MAMDNDGLDALRESAEAALSAGVANRAQLVAAVPALVALQAELKALADRAREARKVADALALLCSEYAHAHPGYVFGETFAVSAIGVASGDLEIDGRTYHFSRGFDGYCRTEQGASMSQGFLKTLPKGWTKQRLELSATGVSKADPGEDELAEHGLARKVKDVWSER